MRGGSHPSEEIYAARRELDDVPGYERLTDLAWYPGDRCWTLHFRLRVPLSAEAVGDPGVPETSDWYALIAPEYPAGMLSIHPAAEGGLSETYPHQTPNTPPRDREPWRGGVVCVATPARGFGRYALDEEPRGSVLRLRWRVQRTRSWVEAARRGELLLEREPFELPVYTTAGEKTTIVFDQAAADLARWETLPERFGYATLTESRANPRLRVLTALIDPHGKAPALLEADWGSLLGGVVDPGPRQRAVWIRTELFPVIKPWRAPRTWGELQECVATGGVDLIEILRQLAPGIRDEKPHPLLIAAPVPIRVGEAPVLLHWLALQLPPLSTLAKPRKGFRAGEEGAWRRDLTQTFQPARAIRWLPTQNWSQEEIATRGRASAALREARIVLIGAGAMGSALAELVVREGAGGAITILDGDTLGVGNLVRHTLTIAEVGVAKASALARRLNALSPYARAVGVDQDFPGSLQSADSRARDALARADVVIDTTGSDALLLHLQEYEWDEDRLFVSATIGFYARRLFLFCARDRRFPLAKYATEVNPWLLQERDEIRGHEMPWEGTGCWNPVFPARASDFAMLAGVTLRQIEARLGLATGDHVLHVMERYEDETGMLLGLRPATLTLSDPDE